MFIRTKEDFVCEKCGTQVEGNGYTNHCPNCLWSKHVDVFPGDREEGCGGMMKPVGVEARGGVPVRILHKCEMCGFERAASIVKEDNEEAVLALVQ